MAKELTPEDRAFLQQNFGRYGEAWHPGFEMLEAHFTVAIAKKWRTFEIALTTRDVFGLRYTLTVRRKNGSMSQTPPALPDGPELTPAERAAVDGVLRELGELWLIEPLNSEVRLFDLKDGLEALAGGRRLSSRRVGDRALLFLPEREVGGALFCVSVDLAARAVERVHWWELPPCRQGRWLPPNEVAFIDRHLRKNGDFGVYGSVTMGLRALAEHFELKIRDEENAYSFSVTPRDYHGHFLHFEMEKASGAIGAAAAGHLEPPPHFEE